MQNAIKSRKKRQKITNYIDMLEKGCISSYNMDIGCGQFADIHQTDTPTLLHKSVCHYLNQNRSINSFQQLEKKIAYHNPSQKKKKERVAEDGK